MPDSRYRRMRAWLYGGYAWLLFGSALVVFGSVALLLRPARTRPVARAMARLLFRLARMPVSVRGLEQLPPQPHILLVNHTSFLDGIVLTALLPARPGYAFAVRQQYRSQIVLWPLLKALGTIALEHAQPHHPMQQHTTNIARLAAALRGGQNLIVFPEGAIKPEPGLQPFHSGAFIAAGAGAAPVVIAALHGTRDALRLGTWLPRRMPVQLQIGPVLVPEGDDEQAWRRLNLAAHAAMRALTGDE